MTPNQESNYRQAAKNHCFDLPIANCLIVRPRERLRSIVMSRPMSVCVSICLSMSACLFVRDGIYRPHARSLPNFLCMLPMYVARSSSGMLTIGRIAYCRDGGDGSAQRGRSIIYDCLVSLIVSLIILGLITTKILID